MSTNFGPTNSQSSGSVDEKVLVLTNVADAATIAKAAAVSAFLESGDPRIVADAYVAARIHELSIAAPAGRWARIVRGLTAAYAVGWVTALAISTGIAGASTFLVVRQGV